MAKDFDLDVQALTTQEGDSKEPRIKSVALCTPGCVPTATLCTSCIFACVDQKDRSNKESKYKIYCF